SHQFSVDMADTYDAAGDVAERVWYGADGQPIRRMTFREGELLDWWQDPAAPSPNTSDTGFHNPDTGVTRSYHLEPDGTVRTTVEHSPSSPGNIENDDIERYDGEGNLLEKLTFQYQRDSYGNWVMRLISAWDPKTDALVPIEEDSRTITYY